MQLVRYASVLVVGLSLITGCDEPPPKVDATPAKTATAGRKKAAAKKK